MNKKVISLLITFLILKGNLKSENIKNVFYILAAPNVCTACFNVYGDLLTQLDKRVDLVFVFDEKELLYKNQLKQKTKNLYLINRSFDVVQNDSFYNYLSKVANKKNDKKFNVPLLLFSDGHKVTKFVSYVDEIANKLEYINTLYKETITLEKIKLKIEESITYSCPSCFVNIINDTFIIGNNFLNKFNRIPLKDSITKATLTESVDILEDNNYINIYKTANNNDTIGYANFRALPYNPLISISSLNLKNSNYISLLYYSANLDSGNIKLGGVNYGLLKLNKNSVKLIPIIFKEKNRAIQLYNFIDGGNDTIIFLTTYHDGYRLNGDYFLAKFIKYDDDSLVFNDFVRDYKYYKNDTKFEPVLTPILKNNWLISFSNNKIYNISKKIKIPFDIQKVIEFYALNGGYKIIPKTLSWVDIVETNNSYKVVFNDRSKIFTFFISKIDGKILNGNKYSFFNEKNPNTSYIFEYNNNYYFYSLDSILTKITFK